MSVSLVRDLCFVDSESNCLCAREGGRAREEWSFVVSHSLGSFRQVLSVAEEAFSLFWHKNNFYVSDFFAALSLPSPFISALPPSVLELRNNIYESATVA